MTNTGAPYSGSENCDCAAHGKPKLPQLQSSSTKKCCSKRQSLHSRKEKDVPNVCNNASENKELPFFVPIPVNADEKIQKITYCNPQTTCAYKSPDENLRNDGDFQKARNQVVSKCKALQEETVTTGDARNRIYYCVSPSVYDDIKSVEPKAEAKACKPLTPKVEAKKSKPQQKTEAKDNKLVKHKVEAKSSNKIKTVKQNTSTAKIKGPTKKSTSKPKLNSISKEKLAPIKKGCCANTLRKSDVCLQNCEIVVSTTTCGLAKSNPLITKRSKNLSEDKLDAIPEIPNILFVDINKDEQVTSTMKNEVNLENHCQNNTKNEPSFTDNNSTSKDKENFANLSKNEGNRPNCCEANANNEFSLPGFVPKNNGINEDIITSKLKDGDFKHAPFKTPFNDENNVLICCRIDVENKGSSSKQNMPTEDNQNAAKSDCCKIDIDKISMPTEFDDVTIVPIKTISQSNILKPPCCKDDSKLTLSRGNYSKETFLFQCYKPSKEKIVKDSTKSRPSAFKEIMSSYDLLDTPLKEKSNKTSRGSAENTPKNEGNDNKTKEQPSISDYEDTSSNVLKNTGGFKAFNENNFGLEEFLSSKPQDGDFKNAPFKEPFKNERNLLDCCNTNVEIKRSISAQNIPTEDNQNAIKSSCCKLDIDKISMDSEFDDITIVPQMAKAESNVLKPPCCKKDSKTTLNFGNYTRETFLFQYHEPSKEKNAKDNPTSKPSASKEIISSNDILDNKTKGSVEKTILTPPKEYNENYKENSSQKNSKNINNANKSYVPRNGTEKNSDNQEKSNISKCHQNCLEGLTTTNSKPVSHSTKSHKYNSDKNCNQKHDTLSQESPKTSKNPAPLSKIPDGCVNNEKILNANKQDQCCSAEQKKLPVLPKNEGIQGNQKLDGNTYKEGNLNRKTSCCDQPDIQVPSRKKWKTCCNEPTCPTNDPTSSTYKFLLRTRLCCNRKSCRLAAKICDIYESLVNIEMKFSKTDNMGEYQYHYLGTDAETTYEERPSAYSYLEEIQSRQEVEGANEAEEPQEAEGLKEPEESKPDEDPTKDFIYIEQEESRRERRASTVSWSIPASIIHDNEPDAEGDVSISGSAEEIIAQATAEANKFRQTLHHSAQPTSIFGEMIKDKPDIAILEGDNKSDDVLYKSQISTVSLDNRNHKFNCFRSLKHKLKKLRRKKKDQKQLSNETLDDIDTSRRSSIEKKRYHLGDPVGEKNQEIKKMLNSF